MPSLTATRPGAGVVVYLRGREEHSIGLTRKVRAYALQDDDPDTVEANEGLGLRIDSPNDAVAAQNSHRPWRDHGAPHVERPGGIQSVRGMSVRIAHLDYTLLI